MRSIEDEILALLLGIDPNTAQRIAGSCLKKLREARYFRRLQEPQEWKPVLRVGFGQYAVSSMGYVRLAKKDGVLSPAFEHKYARAGLSSPNRNGAEQHMVHELVVEEFLLGFPIPADQAADEKVINHIDGDKYNPSLGNLEITLQGQNMLHAYATGLRQGRGRFGI